MNILFKPVFSYIIMNWFLTIVLISWNLRTLLLVHKYTYAFYKGTKYDLKKQKKSKWRNQKMGFCVGSYG